MAAETTTQTQDFATRVVDPTARTPPQPTDPTARRPSASQPHYTSMISGLDSSSPPRSPVAASPTSPVAGSPPRDRRMSKEWDASKVPPSRFQKREGSLYATPGSRDGHIGKNKNTAAYEAKLKEKGWS